MQLKALDRNHFFRMIEYHKDLRNQGYHDIRIILLCNELNPKRDYLDEYRDQLQLDIEVITIKRNIVEQTILDIDSPDGEYALTNNIKFPNLILLLTGGHTQVYLMKSENEIELLGQSVDDAIGEAFDKTAKLIGLSYPGGSEIEKKAIKGDENKFVLPKPLVKEKNFNFSFSGIKTNINLLTKKNKIDKKFVEDLSASFQKNITEILIEKLERGLKRLSSENKNIRSISVVGGVSNNKYIRSKLENFFVEKNIEIYYPIKEMMGDNAAMIAWACMKFYKKDRNDLFFKPMPRLGIRSVL